VSTVRYPLPLAGWDAQSMWGYDEQAGGWFAQLTRNDSRPSDDGAPDIWLNGFSPRIPTMADLQRAIAAATGSRADEVDGAMSQGQTSPF
jgi:hypothetical protein